jgi:hypothetical protein
VVVSRSIHGRINFESPVWKSPGALVISASQLRQTQEAMLLMKPGEWVETACGFWNLTLTDNSRPGAELILAGGQVPA